MVNNFFGIQFFGPNFVPVDRSYKIVSDRSQESTHASIFLNTYSQCSLRALQQLVTTSITAPAMSHKITHFQFRNWWKLFIINNDWLISIRQSHCPQNCRFPFILCEIYIKKKSAASVMGHSVWSVTDAFIFL